MSFGANDLDRLALLLHRLIDADMLVDADAAALLGGVEAARALLTAGATEAGLKHVEHVADFTEALVHSDLLKPTDGLAVITAARRILSEDA